MESQDFQIVIVRNRGVCRPTKVNFYWSVCVVFIVLHFGLCFPQYSQWESFSTAHGLSGVEVYTIFESSTFDLWFGTRGGATRYDGEWTKITKSNGMAGDCVYSIQQDNAGNIWFGTEVGISIYNGKTISNFSMFPHDTVWVISQGRKSLFWLGTANGAYSFNQSDSSLVLVTPDSSIEFDVRDILVDSAENTWFATHNNGIYLQKTNGEWDHFSTDNIAALGSNRITDIFEDRSKHLWFATDGGGVVRLLETGWEKIEYDSLYSRVTAIEQDWDGNYWFATRGAPRSGVVRYDGKSQWRSFSTLDGLAHYDVLCVKEDCFRNIWFATKYCGVSRFDSNWRAFLTAQTEDSLFSYNEIMAIESDGDHLWFGLGGAGTFVYNNNEFKHIDDKFDSCSNNNVYAIEKTRKGGIWFGTFGGAGTLNRNEALFGGGMTFYNGASWDTTIKRIDSDGCDCLCHPFLCPYTPPKTGLADNKILALMEDQKQNLWIATLCGGLCRYNKYNTELPEWTTFTVDSGLGDMWVNAIHEDKSGNIWAGTNSGISRFDGEQWTSFNELPLLKTKIQCIAEDDENRIWFGTENSGVFCYDQTHFQWNGISTEDGLLSNMVYSIAYDRNNKGMWFGTQFGVCRLLNDQWYVYRKSINGLPNDFVFSIFVQDKINKIRPDNSGSEFSEDTTSVLWFGTANGVARFLGPSLPPETSVKTYQEIFTTHSPSFELYARDNLSNFDDISFSYQIQHKIDTIKTELVIDWTSFSFEKTVTPTLPENGQYELRVRARDDEGNIDPTPYIKPFTIDPLLSVGNIGREGGTINSGLPGQQIRLYFPPGTFSTTQDIQISSLGIDDDDVQGLLKNPNHIYFGYNIVPLNSARTNIDEELCADTLEQIGTIAFLDSAFLDYGLSKKSLAVYRKRCQPDSRWKYLGGTLKDIELTIATNAFGKFVIIDSVRADEADRAINLKCRPRLFSTTGNVEQTHTDILFTLGQASKVSITIYNVAGRLVRRLISGEEFIAGENAVSWDGYNEGGERCKSGLYIVQIVTDDDKDITTVAVANQ